MIAAWLDTLPAMTRRVVQGAAVFGATIWVDPLAAGCELAHDDVVRELEYLERRGVLRRVTLTDLDPRYEFRHVFVRDVAYSQIPRAARSRWHQRFAHWLGDERRRSGADEADWAGWVTATFRATDGARRTADGAAGTTGGGSGAGGGTPPRRPPSRRGPAAGGTRGSPRTTSAAIIIYAPTVGTPRHPASVS